MKPDELLELTTIISTKEFELDVYAKTIIESRVIIGKLIFKANTLFIVQDIYFETIINGDEYTNNWTIYCTLKNIKTAKRLEKNYILPKILNKISYEGFYIQIKTPELESGFHIVSHYQFKKIDIYNKTHRKYILKQYIFTEKNYTH